jgi:hypothetical protein
MDNSDFTSFAGAGIIGVLLALLLWAGGVALSIWIFWAIIRSAVRRALWDHSTGIGRPKR